MDIIPSTETAVHESFPNPCLACGACCAFFRATFYWAEADDQTPGGVPAGLTGDFNQFYRFMLGTERKNPRCIALKGEIGESVCCAIYERRASVCRNFIPSHLDGVPNPDCDRARIKHGLAPLTPESWRPGHSPVKPAA